MLVKEFRIPLPLDISEYQVAQLYTVSEMSKQESSGDSGVEVLANEPYEDSEFGSGQYTHKIYYLGNRLPGFLRTLFPRSAFQLEERAWNSFPYCKTTLTNGFLRDRFCIDIETWHHSELDIENVHGLDENEIQEREVISIDIANDKVDSGYSESTDPTLFHSVKTGRGPLTRNWMLMEGPKMCCYKLVRIKFQIFGFERRVENLIFKSQSDLFQKFHRKLFCLIDQWFGLTMEDIRSLEEKTKRDLDAIVSRVNGNHCTNDLDGNSHLKTE
jgi:hypothetical protein